MFRHFDNNMELYIIEDYRDMFPGMKGKALTEQLIKDIFKDKGIEDVCIGRTDRGKPYLCGRDDIFFSVSHSGRYFALLVADSPVGVDIQEESRANTASISRKYFTDYEADIVEREGSDGFFRIWTRKEAYGKYLGTGLAGVLKKVSVTDRDDVDFFECQLEKGMYCACCMEKKE